MPTKSWKNHPQKLLRIPQIHFFPLTALTAWTAQTEEFMFQNVAYWPTVYGTGVTTAFSVCQSKKVEYINGLKKKMFISLLSILEMKTICARILLHFQHCVCHKYRLVTRKSRQKVGQRGAILSIYEHVQARRKVCKSGWGSINRKSYNWTVFASKSVKIWRGLRGQLSTPLFRRPWCTCREAFRNSRDRQ